MRPPNPYNYNLPVGPEMFFGREADLEAVVRGLTGAPGDSFALIGGRRMGKTSFLEALKRALERPVDHLLPVPVLLDMSGERLDSVPAFFRTVAEEAGEVLADRTGSLPGACGWDETRPPAKAFERWLLECRRAVTEREGKALRLILLLDECEQIVGHPWTPDLYGALRALLVGEATRPHLKVVMAGSHRFLTQVRQEGSPLRNVLKYHYLRVLPEEATRDLIVRPTGGILPDPVVREVIRQSGGHPFLTQYLMHHLWEGGLEGATEEAVRRVAAGFPHQRDDFRAWAEGLGDSGRRVYALLLRADGPLSEDEIRAALPAPLPDLPQALEALCYHGLVVQDAADRYAIAGQMFREWFIRTVVPELPPSPPRPDELRLQQLAEHIEQDLRLLKEYEDALRYEDDPRRKERYRREIAQLRESAARYRREYEELRRQAPAAAVALGAISNQLDRMDARLDALLQGQEALQVSLSDLRQTVLDRFDTGERALIAALTEHLDRAQLETVAAILEALETESISRQEMEATLKVVREALAALQQSGVLSPERYRNFQEAVDAPHLDVQHKFKAAIPMIPGLLAYEWEIGLGSGADLEAAWRRLVEWAKGRRKR